MLNRQKFVFVFLRVLQVAGNIQKVLVKTGETVVLNCTCTTQTNGLWNGPKKAASSMKDIDEEQLIPYSQGVLLNPKLDLLKYHIVGSYKNRTCNLMIKTFSSNDEGKYHCQYVKNDTTISRFYRVNIQTPLDVSIKTTRLENTTYLECHATGGSGLYMFKNWEHKSVSGQHIRYIEYPEDVTLVLKKDNYQNSGIYICRVNTDVIDMNRDQYQQKQTLVQYEGGNTTILFNDVFKSTFLHEYCWITIGSLVGGILIIYVWSHIYCYLKREKTCRSNIIQITPGDNYDEVEHLNYNNVIFDNVHNDANMNNDNVSSIIENSDIILRADANSSDDSSSIKEHLNYNNVIFDNVHNDANMNNDNVSSIIENSDIILRADANSSDDSSSIKLSGDGYEHPYQTINFSDIEMHHYTSIVSCNYQNTIIFPPSLTADNVDYLNTATDNLKNPWLVIYKKKQ